MHWHLTCSICFRLIDLQTVSNTDEPGFLSNVLFCFHYGTVVRLHEIVGPIKKFSYEHIEQVDSYVVKDENENPPTSISSKSMRFSWSVYGRCDLG